MTRPVALGVAFVLGVAAIALATLAGRTDLLGAALQPPPPVGLLLGLAASALGVWLLFRSAGQVGQSKDPAQLIRAIRIVFLAVAAFAAAAGWFLGSPVPIIAALVIAGIDVLETTFLLFVTTARR